MSDGKRPGGGGHPPPLDGNPQLAIAPGCGSGPAVARLCQTPNVEIIETVLTLVGGTALGALLTWYVATRDLALRRRLQTTEAFLKVAARAHGYRENHADSGVGTGEQIAAIHLLAELGKRDAWLRQAATAFFDDEADWLARSVHPWAPRLLTQVHAAQVTLSTSRWTR